MAAAPIDTDVDLPPFEFIVGGEKRTVSGEMVFFTLGQYIRKEINLSDLRKAWNMEGASDLNLTYAIAEVVKQLPELEGRIKKNMNAHNAISDFLSLLPGSAPDKPSG